MVAGGKYKLNNKGSIKNVGKQFNRGRQNDSQ